MLELVGSVSTMLHCFPEVDTRILTSWGLLFLDQIEALQGAGYAVLFGCYDVKSKALLYSKGRLVLPRRPPSHLLEFTSPGEDAQWTAESGIYGADDVSEDSGRSRHVSLRVTPGHRMFAQMGNRPTKGSVAWSMVRSLNGAGLVPEPPALIAAEELYSKCSCPPAKAGKADCIHRRGHVRMLAFAATGYVPRPMQPPCGLHAAPTTRQQLQRDLRLDAAQFAAFVELLGFWLGDGSMHYRHRGAGYNGVVFAQKKLTDRAWLREMFAKVGLAQSDWRSGVYDKEQLLITNIAWFTFFDLHFGAKYLRSLRSTLNRPVEVVRPSTRPSSVPVGPPLRPARCLCGALDCESAPIGLSALSDRVTATSTPTRETEPCTASSAGSLHVSPRVTERRTPLAQLNLNALNVVPAKRERPLYEDEDEKKKKTAQGERAVGSLDESVTADGGAGGSEDEVRPAGGPIQGGDGVTGDVDLMKREVREAEVDQKDVAIIRAHHHMVRVHMGEADGTYGLVTHSMEEVEGWGRRGTDAKKELVEPVRDEEDDASTPPSCSLHAPPMKDEEVKAPSIDGEEEEETEDEEELPPPPTGFPPGWGITWGPGVKPNPTKSVQHLPEWTLQELTAAEMRLLIAGLHRADGDFGRGTKEIYTSAVAFRDQLVQALLHCGYSPWPSMKYKAGAIRGYKFRDQSKRGSSDTFTNAFVEGLPPEEQRDYLPIQATTAGWRVTWTHLDHIRNTPSAGTCMPSIPRQGCITRVPYDAARDGRTWCVEVEHKDHLIIAQRAFRDPNDPNGAVTKQSRPIITGNCQMMRDLDASDKAKKMLPFFCEENYTGKVVKEIPAVKSISHFLKQVFEVGQFHPECCVISLVYINRLIGVTGVPLTQSNWKPVAISALVLAQKVWDDTPLINADFSILYPALTVKEINFLERKFLDLLEFKLAVSPSLYAQYYFELRSICEENANAAAQAAGMVGGGGGVRGGSGLGALSRSVLKRVEVRSHLSEEYQKDKHAYKRRSMTIEDIGAKQTKVILS